MPDNLLEEFGVSRAFSSAVHLDVGSYKDTSGIIISLQLIITNKEKEMIQC